MQVLTLLTHLGQKKDDMGMQRASLPHPQAKAAGAWEAQYRAWWFWPCTRRGSSCKFGSPGSDGMGLDARRKTFAMATGRGHDGGWAVAYSWASASAAKQATYVLGSTMVKATD
jgi:hypothetical protein